MYTGSDVFKELTQADFNNNSLSNLFGHGFIKVVSLVLVVQQKEWHGQCLVLIFMSG